jgi:tRNA(Leu) C34 or U34 (ribose-2'-O)-methylase TrmL
MNDCVKIFIVIYEPVYSFQSIKRLCECFNTELYVIGNKSEYINHLSDFNDFVTRFVNHRKILMTPYTNNLINDFVLQDNDVLLFGNENGLPTEYAKYFEYMLAIKMPSNCIALSLYISVAITLQFTL